jgi:hypothetical protein
MRTSCGYEVEGALVRELKAQGFPEDITREVLAGYDLDRILFEAVLREASIKIDERDKEVRGKTDPF